MSNLVRRIRFALVLHEEGGQGQVVLFSLRLKQLQFCRPWSMRSKPDNSVADPQEQRRADGGSGASRQMGFAEAALELH